MNDDERDYEEEQANRRLIHEGDDPEGDEVPSYDLDGDPMNDSDGIV